MMTPALQDALLDLLARRLDGPVPGKEAVDWATRALEEGVETNAVLFLAGLPQDCSAYEAAQLLDRAISELELKVPAAEELRRAYVSVISRALLAGRVRAEDALERIHSRAVTPLGHPPDLEPWCFVWEGLHPDDYRILEPSQQEEEARRLARAWSEIAPKVGRPSA